MPTPCLAPHRRIAVIGGGITGLAAAHRLLELDSRLEIALLESGPRLGGILQTIHQDGYLIERSADMFTTREPWGLDLCRRLGIEAELIETNQRHRRAFVAHRGKLVPVPEGFTLMSPAKIGPILSTPLLSLRGKLRLACEYFTPAAKNGGDESLQSFAVRRFGREVFERLVQPLIGGIYTADPAVLSMQATMPQFVAMERQHGSLIRAARAAKPAKEKPTASLGSGARYGMFLAPRIGMQQLVDALAAKLPTNCIQLNCPVERMERREGWEVTLPGGLPPEKFDAVILATPAPIAARLLASTDPGLASNVGSIPQAGCTVAVLGYRREQIAHPLDGFGFVVPAVEKRRIFAGSFSSVKFEGRAPPGKVLLRIFLGGALQPEMGQLPDVETRRLVQEELAELLGVQGPPEFCQVIRWHGAMPQYHVGHLELAAKIAAAVANIPGLAVAGNSFHGVGVPYCIHDGEQAAERLLGQQPG